LSRELEVNGRLLPENAAAAATARFNGDFRRSENDKCYKKALKHTTVDGSFVTLTYELQQSLLQLAMNLTQNVKARTKESLLRQVEVKREKHEIEKATHSTRAPPY
jgi:heme exporter protein D